MTDLESTLYEVLRLIELLRTAVWEANQKLDALRSEVSRR